MGGVDNSSKVLTVLSRAMGHSLDMVRLKGACTTSKGLHLKATTHRKIEEVVVEAPASAQVSWELWPAAVVWTSSSKLVLGRQYDEGFGGHGH